MKNKPAEWMKQAEYDMDTAKYMIAGGRYSYALFMCHMCLEKALKALYQEKRDEIPPKTHNLILLLTKLDIKPDKGIAKILTLLSEANISARYPESLEVLQRIYTETVSKELLAKSEEALKWIKGLF
jgi:HEPN domain-containing protein